MSVENIDNMIEVHKEYGDIIKKLKEDNFELNNENDDLQGNVENLNCECGLFEEQIQELIEENEKLKDGFTKEEASKFLEENQSLKEENEKLIEEIECRKSTTDSEIAEFNFSIQLLKDILKGYEKKEEEWLPLSGVNGIMNDLFYGGYHTSKVIGGDPEEVIQGVKELKEQIDKLKKPRRTITCSSCGQTGHNKTSKKCPNVIDA